MDITEIIVLDDGRKISTNALGIATCECTVRCIANGKPRQFSDAHFVSKTNSLKKDGKFKGEGTLIFKLDDYIIGHSGHFVDGKVNGSGELVTMIKSGIDTEPELCSVYRGNFKNGRPEGKGTYTRDFVGNLRVIHEGELVDGKLDGKVKEKIINPSNAGAVVENIVNFLNGGPEEGVIYHANPMHGVKLKKFTETKNPLYRNRDTKTTISFVNPLYNGSDKSKPSAANGKAAKNGNYSGGHGM
jgi:hypothetical protein